MRRTVALLVTTIALMFVSTGAVSARDDAHEFSDCRDCPQMVVISPGAFMMGSPATETGRSDAEGPRHKVTIAKAFAIARFDVTREQYAAFAAATHAAANPKCDWRTPKSRGTPLAQSADEPVVCANWTDAQAYVSWLGHKTGRHYFLPSEAQWEYAARAGSTTARPWGDAITHENANYGADSCCGPATAGRDRWLYTSPVGSFPPNAFGLSDMIGNVWQWTEDCAEDYTHTPVDGSPAISGDCSKRIIRGGGWFHGPDAARSASRVGDDADRRVADIGFRVAAEVK